MSASIREWITGDSPTAVEKRAKSGEICRRLNASESERKRRSELMKRRHLEGTTGLPKAGGRRCRVSPLPPKIKKKSRRMSPEASARAAEHMRRVNREVLTPEKRREMGKKASQTIKSRRFTAVEYPATGGPNKMEAAVLAIIAPLGFRYVGDGRFWIGPCLSRKCRNPDFIFGRGRDKIAILFHGRYWHSLAKADDAVALKDYETAGWRVLTILENELKDSNSIANRVRSWLTSLESTTPAPAPCTTSTAPPGTIS